MAELSPHRTERQALLDKDAPSMAKYNSRVGRARLANLNARNQARAKPVARASHPTMQTQILQRRTLFSCRVCGPVISHTQPRVRSSPTHSYPRPLSHLKCHLLVSLRVPQRMGVVSVAFALKLTKDNRVGLAASETPSPPSLNSRAGDAGAATAEQQQVVRFPLRPGHEYSPCIPGALTPPHTL